MKLSTPTFHHLAQLVREQSAIVLDPDKDYLVESRLTPLLCAEKMGSFEQLALELRRDRSSTLQRRVIDALTNNETWFFRDAYPFQALKDVIFPELVERCEKEHSLTIWSAACSTGQEIYSVAMLLHENFPRLMGWDLRLLGTDISGIALARAKRGCYSEWEANRGLPVSLRSRYFSKAGVEWELGSQVRRMVNFQSINLAGPWPALGAFDVIFLRNVLIYFSGETRKKILAKVRQVLRPQGYLFLGSAETTLNLDDSYQRIPFQDSFYYQPKG